MASLGTDKGKSDNIAINFLKGNAGLLQQAAQMLADLKLSEYREEKIGQYDANFAIGSTSGSVKLQIK